MDEQCGNCDPAGKTAHMANMNSARRASRTERDKRARNRPGRNGSAHVSRHTGSNADDFNAEDPFVGDTSLEMDLRRLLDLTGS